MPTVRLALAQLNVTVGDLDGNRRLIEQAIRRAQAWQADLLVVPELSICGYPPEDLLLKPQFIEDNRQALSRLAPFATNMVALVGFVDQDQRGQTYNAAAVLANGRHVTTYRKQCLPNYGVFDEPRYFTAGSQAVILSIRDVRVGVTICEDLWEPQPSRVLAAAGAQVVANLSASPYHVRKLQARQALFRGRARAHGLAIAYCNLVGGQDELVFDGASMVIDSSGKTIGLAAQCRVDLLIADLPVEVPRRLGRSRSPVIPVLGRRRERPPLARPAPQRVLGPVEEVYEALALGLKDYARKNRFSTVVLGLSGGIDSAVTACLAVDALGAEQVVGVVMPSRFSSQETQDDARQLAGAFGIRCHTLTIEPMFEAYLKVLESIFANRPMELAEQNLQARIRGSLLMALSNKFGWLVLATGNKSEMATGYTTLYGDMAGGLAVIKDVPKTLVYQLARWRNARGPAAPIPSGILTRAPTAELAPNQRDQDTLPAYETLDRIITAYVEEDRSLRDIVRQQGIDPSTARQVITMIDRSEYKRRQGPPGIKITPKAFGRDRRMPITNQYRAP